MPDPTAAELVALLERLAGSDDPDGYDSVAAGRSASVITRRHVAIFLRYRRYVRPGTILDWGCRHAPDACLLRAAGDRRSTLHGCDVAPPASAAAHGFARLEFRRLEDTVALPYPDRTFDTIIASGVLEHVDDDTASLAELHRVLRPGGRLIITFLPNWLSYTEAIARATGLLHHDRLYSMTSLRRMIVREGLGLVRTGHHQLTPSLTGKAHRVGRGAVALAESAYRYNGVLERLWPLSLAAANIWAIAERRGG